MRAAEIIFSAIVAFAIAYVIFAGKKQVPEILSATSNGYTITHTVEPTVLEDSVLNISVTITGPPDSTIKFWFRSAKVTQNDATKLYLYAKSPLIVINADSGKFRASLQTGQRSNVLRYYFEVRDPVGRLLVELKKPDEQPIKTAVFGRVDSWIKYGYFLTMFLAILAITRGAIASIGMAGGKGEMADVRPSFMWGVLFSFISAVLLKTWFGFQQSGELWRAVPFGAELNDNSQQILIIYLLFISLVTAGHKKSISKSTIGYLGIFTFFLMAAAYLLPLVIESTAFPVSIVSYVIVAIILLATIVVLRTRQHV